ncbi:site-specific integrase [Microvirga sp. STR05]|uniref:Site-specific integrase n=1 Tax=Hymenobacter duratus TaxID=2771356 RepID=A0ABR8JC60_9BACT|nr:site-specific integrase [Hymenobacter duratus]MBD2714364.1 site-specific integrase [Hymenobacter duratus]MBR7949267.1 site-specific integrase [Microvirga sp. STR05]
MSKTTDYKEGRATVRIVYFTSKVLADGSHPFLVCITKNRQRKYLATGLSLLPKYWNAEKSNFRDAIRKSYLEPHREKLITDLRNWEDKYSDAATSLAGADEQHDARAVAAKAIEGRKATRRILLLAYIEELAQGMVATGQIGNAGVYRDLSNQLAKFIKAEYDVTDVPFERVTVSFCNEWEATLRATGAQEITLSLRFRTLRAVLNRAIAAGVSKPVHYPFARTVAEKHKFSVGKFDVSTTKRALPRDAVRRLEALETDSDRLRLAKEVFLFSFYGGGINFVDLAQLRWRDLSFNAENRPERLNYVRQKTGGKFSLKLLAPAAALITSYAPLTRATPDSYIFPVLDPARHRTPTQIKNRLHKVLGQVNKDLKVLASQAGIDTTLTTYVARHSFATALKLAGENTGVISQAMGHKSEAITAIYLDSFASELVDTAFERLL